MFKTVLVCSLTLIAFAGIAHAAAVSPYSLSCTGGGSIPFANPHVWNTGGAVIPAKSNVEVTVAGESKPVVTKLTSALKPGETFVTAGTAKPPYKCSARIL